MKKYLFLILLSFLIVPLSTSAQKKSKRKKAPVQQTKTMQNEIDSVSYAFGMLIGANMKDVGFENFNFEIFTEALIQVLTNKPGPFDDDRARIIVNKYVSGLMDKESENNLVQSNDFLELNSKNEGVVSLPSGLQYKILESGNGMLPGPESKVKVHYTGMLADGTIFDSSHDTGEPVVIPLNMVIKGWSEALQLMPVGSKWIIYIPPHLGYGDSSPQGSPIKSNSALIFEVMLIGIEE